MIQIVKSVSEIVSGSWETDYICFTLSTRAVRRGASG